MASDTKQIVDKAWAFAHILREEGLSYLAYTEQITFLLFLKMAHEISERYPQRTPLVPNEWNWASLTNKTGSALKQHYDQVLESLSHQPGMLGDIFRKPRPEIENPRTLRRLIVDLVGGETWTTMDADVKGDIYEGLLARTAAESPRGAGQYFTPRELIAAIVDCVRPTVRDTVCDPAAGTGGFLLAAHSFVSKCVGPKPTRSVQKHLTSDLVHGWELVPNTARLCVMNLYLHGVEADPSPLHIGADSLAEPPRRRFSVVLTNPPFGKKGSVPIGRKVTNSYQDEAPLRARPDLWVTTANKQLNFLQHAYTLLEPGGRCAIVLPDNVLSETGAGEIIRRRLFEECNVHTLLRLPPGIFYAQGVKANVLFFDRERPPRNASLWVYDLRTDKHFTLRQRPIRRSDLNEFVECYSPEALQKRRATWSTRRPQGRWRRFDHKALLANEKISLDLTWLAEEERRSANAELPPSYEIAAAIADDLQAALKNFQRVSADLSRRR